LALLWTMVLCEYQSDSTDFYGVGISSANQGPGGFSALGPGAVVSIPRGWKLRHILGKSATGSGHKLEIATLVNELFIDGTTFTITYNLGAAGTFNVMGRIGELRAVKY
jgi:hypothetical protein